MGNIKMQSDGFSLVELMVAIAIFGVISGAIYATYQYQQDLYLAQEKVADMQQNLRAGMYFMARDMRLAGYDPSEKAEALTNANNIAKAAEIRFAFDDDDDGVIQNNEYIRYALTSDGANGINDATRDGLANSFPCNLGKETGITPNNSGLQPVAENVQALEFFYHLADGTTSTAPGSFSDIRSIDVSLLVRTGNKIKGYKDTETYYPASNPNHATGTGTKVWGPFNDNYRRKLLIAQIKCRNLGL